MREMNENEYPGLPKWPACVVAGEPITEDQAAEILLRTDSLWLSTNDRDWDEVCKAILGAPDDGDWEAKIAWRKSLGSLPTSYLSNDRIGSSYVYGPHGWCNWDGAIGCCHGNIGKWPSVEEVRDEWVAIADAFPYLSLRCQLWSNEACEDGGCPVVEFVVKEGSVTVCFPEGELSGAPRGADGTDLMDIFRGHRRERGCTAEQLRHAMNVVKQRLSDA